MGWNGWPDVSAEVVASGAGGAAGADGAAPAPSSAFGSTLNDQAALPPLEPTLTLYAPVNERDSRE